MKVNFDYHTHTKYSDGKGTILESALAAKEKGLLGIAITDHGFSHPAFGMRRRKLDKMRAECDEAAKQSGVEVLLGIESNILGERGLVDVKEKDYLKLDFLVAGVHRFVYYDRIKDYLRLFGQNMFYGVFKCKPTESLIKYDTKVYLNVIKNNPVDILAHINYYTFSDAVEVAKCCADYGTYLEISTKKVHLSPEVWQDVIDKTSVQFVINSDAHTPQRIGDTRLFDSQDKLINFPKDRIVNIGDEKPKFRFQEFKSKL